MTRSFQFLKMLICSITFSKNFSQKSKISVFRKTNIIIYICTQYLKVFLQNHITSTTHQSATSFTINYISKCSKYCKHVQEYSNYRQNGNILWNKIKYNMTNITCNVTVDWKITAIYIKRNGLLNGCLMCQYTRHTNNCIINVIKRKAIFA
jgi:hypothetical protein